MGHQIKRMGWMGSFSIFVPAALLMFVLTRYFIPYLSEKTGQETILCWFLVGGLGVFLPLVITAFLVLRAEGYKVSMATWTLRLRFKRLTRKDWMWIVGGLILIMLSSFLVMKGLEMVIGKFDNSPPFMSFEPLSTGRYWLLAAWFPYWILNILGEEILWRGVMLPRQEVSFGKKAWAIHACGWGLFHVAFGWQLLITLLPIIFIQSFIVQKTKNSWTGVIIHGAINGPSFIAIALGLI